MGPKVRNPWYRDPPRPAEADGSGSYWNLQTEEAGWRERCHTGAGRELGTGHLPTWAWLSLRPPASCLGSLGSQFSGKSEGPGIQSVRAGLPGGPE